MPRKQEPELWLVVVDKETGASSWVKAPPKWLFPLDVIVGILLSIPATIILIMYT
jgi:hypothetical protein